MKPPQETILIIDDSAPSLQLASDCLLDAGFDILVAQDGLSGCRIAGECQPDLILLDVKMPKIDGLETCRLLKTETTTQDIPVIFMTGMTDMQLKVKGFELGGVDYIIKPFEQAEILARIRAHLDRRRLQTDLKQAYDQLEERVQQRTRDLENANKALKKSEQRYRTLIDTSIEGVFSIDTDARITFVNRRMAEMLGYVEDDMLGTPIMNFLDKENAAILGEKLKQRRRGHDGQYDLCMCCRNGSRRWVIVNATPLFDQAGDVVGSFGMATDVTDRKRAVDALHESRKRYRAVVEDMPAMICRFLPDGTLTFVNNAYCDYFKKQEKELLGENFFQLVPPKGRQRVRDRFKSLTRENSIVTNEHQVTGSDNQSRWQEWTDRALFDETGHLTEYQSLGRDITETKLAREQKELIEAQLLQAQKLESIGTLAGGIAHDFNNILAAIVGYSEISLTHLTAEQPIRRNLEKILQSAYRASDLIKQILTFSRKTDQNRTTIHLRAIIEEALKLLRATLPATIEIHSHLEAENDTVLADMTQMHQILMNLCTNAKHAMRENGGVMEISLKEEKIANQTAVGHFRLSPGTFLKLTVSDTGHGIRSDELDKIFDPYFTTKPLGEGTGLGLSVVHGIVKDHGGAIDVSSQMGSGTVFDVFLPISHATRQKKDNDVKPLITGNEHILLVDDEKNIVDSYSQMLISLGYRVTGMSDSRQALSAFRSRPNDFDLVLTDYTMPHMTGIQLAEAMLKIQPDIPILLSSGYSRDNIIPQLNDMGIKGILLKPLDKGKISKVLRQCLQPPFQPITPGSVLQ